MSLTSKDTNPVALFERRVFVAPAMAFPTASSPVTVRSAYVLEEVKFPLTATLSSLKADQSFAFTEADVNTPGERALSLIPNLPGAEPTLVEPEIFPIEAFTVKSNPAIPSG
ncbi:hypothetical protein [Rufibacter immobilis]|uniref:hypothetical protein n=1 Tax=Rufibacter immobilis TaxID=1348778 RepID=UPI0035EFA138